MKYLVTGTTRGIGLAFVKNLAANPENFVYATVRSQDKVAAILDLGFKNVKPVVIDMTQSLDDFKKAFEVIGDDIIDVVIHNAGMLLRDVTGPTIEQSIESYTTLFETNFLGTVKVYQAAYPYLYKGEGLKKFVALSTLGATMGGMQINTGGYGVSKVGINFFIKQLSCESAQSTNPAIKNSISLAIAPGMVLTDMAHQSEVDLSQLPQDLLITPEESVKRMMEVIDGAKKETHDGGFYNYDGTTFPY